jgi:hypothetical protein
VREKVFLRLFLSSRRAQPLDQGGGGGDFGGAFR